MTSSRWVKRSVEGLSASTEAARIDALYNLRTFAATNTQYGKAIIAAGAVPRLVDILSGTSGEDGFQSKLHAAATLKGLCYGNVEMQRAVVDGGAIPPLVFTLGGESPADLKEEAVGALRNLSSACTQHGDAVMEAGSLQPLLQLIRDGLIDDRDMGPCVGAAGTIRKLVAKSPTHERALVDSGGLPTLVRLLECACVEAQEQAAGIFRNLVRRNEPYTERSIMAAGVARPLIECLRDGDPMVQGQAAGALICLVDRMVELLQSDDTADREAGAFAIACLADISEENRVAILEEGAVPHLVGLMLPRDPPELSLQGVACASVRNLARSPNTHPALHGSQAVPALIDILENGVATEEERRYEATPSVIATGAAAVGELAITDFALRDLLDADVIRLLVNLVQSEDPDIQVKGAFALAKFVGVSLEARKAFMQAQIVPALIQIVAEARADVREQTCILVAALTQYHPFVVAFSFEGGTVVLQDLAKDQGYNRRVRAAARNALRAFGVEGVASDDEAAS